MSVELAIALVGGGATVLVAIIEAIAARERKKDRAERERADADNKRYRKHREEQEAAREELMLLMMDSTNAAIALGEATAHAMQRGYTNGDMEKALEYATSVKHKQKTFLSKRGIHSMWDDGGEN